MNRLYYTEKVKPNQCISTLTSIYCASTGEILHIPRQVRNQTTKSARPRTHTTTNLCYYPTNASLFFAEMWLLKAPPWRSPTGTWTRSQIWLSSCRPRLESRFCGSPATCSPTRGDLCLTAAERERRLSFLNPNINCAGAQTLCRYMNGAATNPDCHVLAFAGAQLKKGLDVAKKLGAENFGKSPPALQAPACFAPRVSVSPQCSGEEEKVSTPSTTPTSPRS